MTPYYEHGGITIYHGDCREILPQLASGSVDLVFTSPPYNLGEGMEDKGGLRIGHVGSKWSRDDLVGGYGVHTDAMPYANYVTWQRGVLGECWRVLSSTGAIYYNHKPRVVRGVLRTPLTIVGDLPIRQIVIWDRGSGFNYMSGAYMPMHEWIVLIAKPDFVLRDKGASGVGDVWSIPPETNTRHPAPFPLALPARAIETAAPRTVLDPFMGSGTTLRAAKDAGCEAIGIELNEQYCELAAERLSQNVLDLESA